MLVKYIGNDPISIVTDSYASLEAEGKYVG